MSLTFAVYTLGCKVNYYESTAISEALVKEGLTELDFSESADIYIVNTCAVTGESERKACQIIRRAKNKNPDAYVIVTGCLAQLYPQKAEKCQADFICGNREKMLAARAALDYAKKSESERKNIKKNIVSQPLEGAGFEMMNIRHSERTRAYIKIGDGCEGRCSYCIINRARGPVRSKPMPDVLNEAKELVSLGYSEIVLTAIEISNYGRDLENIDLCGLILALDKIPGLCRIRLGSLDPAMLKEEFVKKLSCSEKLCPHFHLSLQSGCDKTLAAMRRKYNTDMVKKSVELIRAAFPDAAFSADVIVGFPGESEEDFLASAEFAESLELLHAHIFPFSARRGTQAESMPLQVKKEEKNRRASYLLSLCELSRDRFLDRYKGRVMPVLFEEDRDGYSLGHTANFIKVSVKSDKKLHAKMQNVLLTECREGVMLGEVTEDPCVLPCDAYNKTNA